MRVLVVDDQITVRQILTWVLQDMGHEIIEAKDGAEAIIKFESESPDLVLMDVVMPVMDGFEATRRIKSLALGAHVPVIFLTGLEDKNILPKCLDSGGDDFLGKPIETTILQAKIRAHERVHDLYQQIRRKNDELTYLHARLEQEHRMGEHVIANAMKDNFFGFDNIKHFISPMSAFNGDLLMVAPKAGGGLYALLGDFTGHGLAASIGAIPASQGFFSMARKSLPVTEIVKSLNSVLTRFLPDHMFFAATVLELNAAGDQITIWAGGLPDAYLIREEQGVVHRVVSAHMPLGVLEEDFDSTVEILRVKQGDRLLMYTDGIIESSNSDNEMFGVLRLQESLASSRPERQFESLLEAFHRFIGVSTQDDDISLFELTARAVESELPAVYEMRTRIPWRIKVHFDAFTLRENHDAVTQVIDMLPKDGVFAQHFDILHTVLSELYANSLEHGVLGLDSKMKETDEGFVGYYELRSHRLSTLDDGFVTMQIEFDPAGPRLKIKLTDSGKGFDVVKVMQREEDPDLAFGRGLNLMRELCEHLEYVDGGRSVHVHYLLN